MPPAPRTQTRCHETQNNSVRFYGLHLQCHSLRQIHGILQLSHAIARRRRHVGVYTCETPRVYINTEFLIARRHFSTCTERSLIPRYLTMIILFVGLGCLFVVTLPRVQPCQVQKETLTLRGISGGDHDLPKTSPLLRRHNPALVMMRSQNPGTNSRPNGIVENEVSC